MSGKSGNKLEREWRGKICQQMRECNAMVFAIVPSIYMEPGWPDVHVHHAYWRGWIEFKGAETLLTEKQRVVIRELNKRHSGSAFIARHSGNENVGYLMDERNDKLGIFETGKELLKILAKL